jgi:hypothetical protein
LRRGSDASTLAHANTGADPPRQSQLDERLNFGGVVVGTRNLRPTPVIALLALMFFSGIALGQGSWSDWSAPRGGDGNLDYRWRRVGICLANGCSKEVQFRNLGKTTLRFDYTVWAKGMVDPSDEVKQSSATSVTSEQTSTVPILIGGDVVRVVVQMHR